MAKEKTRETFRDLHAAPVREGETWKQYVDRLRGQPTLGASEIAGVLCATALMGQNPNAPARGRMLDALSERLTKQSSFRQLVRDPEALRLARSGKGAEMIVLMGEKKQRQEEARRRYQRSKAQVRDDAIFLRAAEKSMKDSFAQGSPAQKERENQRFLEMMKRMDHARSLAEQGSPLDGKTARELAQAVQQYNNGGGRTPGGKQQAAASKEALCVLKHLMPENEFNDYCASINQAHKAWSPNHRRHVEPSDYGEALLRGGAKTAKDLMLASQRQLNRGMTLDGCATVTAIMQLSRGNPNAIIRRDTLEAEIKKLKQPGSAFLRTMSDEAARGKYAELSNQGKGVLLGKSLLQASREHSVRSAQWQIDQSTKSAARDGGADPNKLAAILAAREMAVNANAAQNITPGAFKAKTEEIRSSPAFVTLAARYREDPSLRARINQGLTRGDGGKALEQEYQKIKTPEKELSAETEKKIEEKIIEPPVLKKPER